MISGRQSLARFFSLASRVLITLGFLSMLGSFVVVVAFQATFYDLSMAFTSFVIEASVLIVAAFLYQLAQILDVPDHQAQCPADHQSSPHQGHSGPVLWYSLRGALQPGQWPHTWWAITALMGWIGPTLAMVGMALGTTLPAEGEIALYVVGGVWGLAFPGQCPSLMASLSRELLTLCLERGSIQTVRETARIVEPNIWAQAFQRVEFEDQQWLFTMIQELSREGLLPATPQMNQTLLSSPIPEVREKGVRMAGRVGVS